MFNKKTIPLYISPDSQHLEYTECISAEEEGPPPTRVLDMTLNNQ